MASIGQFQDRTIYDFKTRLSGGGARSNLFECEIVFPTSLKAQIVGDDEANINIDTRFLIKAAQLPGSTTNTIPVPFRGRTLKIAGDRTFDSWTITVLNDTNFRLRNAFERWSNSINRHDDNSGTITPAAYQTDLVVHQLSRGVVGDTTNANIPVTASNIPILKSYKLYGCYPSAIDPIPLSYDTSDAIEEFNVTFEVQWWDAFNATGARIFDTINPNAAIPTPPASGLL